MAEYAVNDEESTDADSSYPAEWEPRITNLSARFAVLSRDSIIKELRKTDGHAGKASGVLAAMARTPEETAAREARLTQEREAQATASAECEAWWARVRESPILDPATSRLTVHGAKCCLEAMKLPSMRKTITFESCWDGRTLYSHSAADGAVVKEYESVHGGPRIGEPGALREVLSDDDFLASLRSGSVHQSSNGPPTTLPQKVRDWLGIAPLPAP